MSTEDTPRKGLDRFTIGLILALLVAAAGTFVAWRRARNPLRMWAKQAQQSHAREIDRALQRCFGTTSVAGVRQLVTAVQRGPMPAPFKDCHRGPMTELLVAPNAFVSSLQTTPLELYRVRETERVALQRLTASVRLLEHVVTAGGASPTDAQRQEIARKLEDLLPDLEHERTVFEDLIAVAEQQAGTF
jgi:hypothetical protein